jgi:hypothetical protein
MAMRIVFGYTPLVWPRMRGDVMIFLWLALVVLFSFVLLSVALVWSQLEAGMFVSILCLLQSIEERFDLLRQRLHVDYISSK